MFYRCQHGVHARLQIFSLKIKSPNERQAKLKKKVPKMKVLMYMMNTQNTCSASFVACTNEILRDSVYMKMAKTQQKNSCATNRTYRNIPEPHSSENRGNEVNRQRVFCLRLFR